MIVGILLATMTSDADNRARALSDLQHLLSALAQGPERTHTGTTVDYDFLVNLDAERDDTPNPGLPPFGWFRGLSQPVAAPSRPVALDLPAAVEPLAA